MAISSEFIGSAFQVPSFLHLLRTLVFCAVILTPLEYFFPAQPQSLLSRKGLALDFCYWFLTPILTRIVTTLAIMLILAGAFFLLGRTLEASLLDGYGPLSRQPLWLQSIEILVLADFIDYWTHRLFHRPAFWDFHAIHHSPEEMSWMSSARVHPVNDLVTRSCQVIPLALCGFAAKAVIILVPYLSIYVMFVHSNVSWNFGPFRYFLVSPAYHRWHHTSDKEAFDKNFAGIFPIWDLLFGTVYLPGGLPRRYGVAGPSIPTVLFAQLAYPFVRLKRKLERRSAAAGKTLPSAKQTLEKFADKKIEVLRVLH